MDCIFCKIAAREIPGDIVYEDDKLLAFRDIAPAAPVHILIIPKAHISSAMDITEENSAMIAHIYEAAAKIAVRLGVAEKGFRIVTNCGENGGQTVGHLHFHLLGGRALQWPPG